MKISDVDVLISFGSNIDKEDGVDNILMCQQALRLFTSSNFRFSSIYETIGEGSGAGKNYINCLATGKTSKTQSELESLFKRLEIHTGRDDDARNSGIVAIDIDLLIYNKKIVREKDLNMYYVKQGLKELDITL